MLLSAIIALLLPSAEPGITQSIAPPTVVENARSARNLMVFDATAGRVRRHFYDQTFGGQDWDEISREQRPKAAKATHELELYLNVLEPMVRKLPGSHSGIIPPPPPKQAKAAPPSSEACLRQAFDADFGLHLGRSRSPNGTKVIDFDKGSAADLAGVEPGWLLQRYSLHRENCGPQHVVLEFYPQGDRPGRKVEYDLNPQPSQASHAARTLTSGARLIRFDEFQDEDIRWAIAELRGASAAGVILDLRRNGGGQVRLLTEIAGVLLGPGKLIGTEVRAQGRREMMTRKNSSRGFAYSGPLVVLIGPESGSAAEVLSGALRAHDRAELVGDQTAGAVLIARRFRLPDGGWVQVPVADYLDVSGGRLEDIGVKPHVAARQTLAAIRDERDLIVEAAELAMTKRRVVHAGSKTLGEAR